MAWMRRVAEGKQARRLPCGVASYGGVLALRVGLFLLCQPLALLLHRLLHVQLPMALLFQRLLRLHGEVRLRALGGACNRCGHR